MPDPVSAAAETLGRGDLAAAEALASVPLEEPRVPRPAQRYPPIPRAKLPAGLGIASVMPQPGGMLHFYRPPQLGEAPGDYAPSDSVRFEAGQPSVAIAESGTSSAR